LEVEGIGESQATLFLKAETMKGAKVRQSDNNTGEMVMPVGGGVISGSEV